jgi:hypothetical protein
VSAPALHPTPRMRPVLLDRLERQRGAHCWAALVLAGLAVYLRVDSVQVTYSAALFCVVVGGFFLPDLQEIAPGDQPVWDAALPVEPSRYALVRLGCGVAGAAFLLAVVIALYAALFGDPAHPGWYPLTLFAAGLTVYLGMSAVLLARDQASSIIYVVVMPTLYYVTLPIPVLLLDPVEIERMAVLEVLARAALPLGLAGAAAYAAARFQARAPAPAGPAPRGSLAPRRDPARALPDWPAPCPVLPAPCPVLPAPIPNRPAPRPIRRGGPARPPSALTVFRQHFALLRRFAALPALTLLVLALVVLVQLSTEPPWAREGQTVRYFVESAGLGEWCAWLAGSWAVLVWLGERGARRRWNDARPVGTAKRRILHAAAGAAWLLLFLTVVVAAPLGGALAAGTLHSPADVPTSLWLGLPCRALVLYLTATFVFFGMHVALYGSFYLVPKVLLPMLPARTPFGLKAIVMVVGMIGVPYLCFTRGIGLLESQWRIVTGDAGSDAAAALWLVLSAAAAAGAVALSDWIHHLDRFPTAREARDVFHGWTGTRPGPPLHSHAGR